MNRAYKVYEKNGYTYVHYEGFPEAVKIDKNKVLCCFMLIKF